VRRTTGNPSAALGYYVQALHIFREVGDRVGEAVRRNNIAMAHWGAGRLAEAVGELELVVAFYAAVEHPSLEASTAMLKRVRTKLDQDSPGGDADVGGGGP
jgi:hypothetical protein